MVDWNNFIDSLELEKLEQTSYHYRIWKKDLLSGKKISLAQCKDSELKRSLQVACNVPNDTWYFDIEPKEGWYSIIQVGLNGMICILLAFLIATIYYQFRIRRYKERLYAEKIKKRRMKQRQRILRRQAF